MKWLMRHKRSVLVWVVRIRARILFRIRIRKIDRHLQIRIRSPDPYDFLSKSRIFFDFVLNIAEIFFGKIIASDMQ